MPRSTKNPAVKPPNSLRQLRLALQLAGSIIADFSELLAHSSPAVKLDPNLPATGCRAIETFVDRMRALLAATEIRNDIQPNAERTTAS